MEKKKELILSMVPFGTKNILDIGCKNSLYKDCNVTTLDCLVDADINQDLNKNQILPFEDDSFDLVVMNQILEHIADVDVLVKESKRVAKKHIFIGLPNELNWKARIRFLFGIPGWKGYMPFYHKHFFTVEEIEHFVVSFFGDYITKEYWEPSKYKWFPSFFNRHLARILPSVFCKEVYYLIKLDDAKRGVDER